MSYITYFYDLVKKIRFNVEFSLFYFTLHTIGQVYRRHLYIYVFGVSNVLISSFKSPPHAHPLFFTPNVRFAKYLEQEIDTLICLESEY